MKKFVSTIVLAAFTAVCSFGAAAADTSSKGGNTAGSSDSKEKWEKKYGEGGRGNESTSDITKNKEPKDLGPGVKYEYRDQEVMDKKPYKEKK